MLRGIKNELLLKLKQFKALKEIDPHLIINDDSLLPCAAKLPVSKCRAGNKALKPEEHIFVKAVCESHTIDKPSDQVSKIKKIFIKNLSMASFRNAADRIGLKDCDVPLLAKEPSWLRIYPWTKKSVKERLDQINSETYKENKLHGLDLNAYQGGALISTSQEKLELEVVRLQRLMCSIKKFGYKRSLSSEEEIGAIIYVMGENEWRWGISGGMHRAAVLAGLDYEEIPVIVHKIIKISDMNDWFSVKSDLFPKKVAEKYFNSLFK